MWIKLAQFYSDLNREHDALQTLHQASELIADNADIYYDMGLVQVRLRGFSKAVTSLAKAAVKAPENAHYSYGYILKDLEHLIAVGELADNSVNFFVRVWVESSDLLECFL